MGMVAILFNFAEPFEQIGNTFLTGPKWNLVKIAQAVSEKKTFKNFTHVYSPRYITLWGQNFDYN